MKKVLVVDPRRSMNSDIKLQLIVDNIESKYSIDAYNPANGTDLESFLGGKFYDFMLIEHTMLNSMKPEDFGTAKIYGYNMENNATENFDKYKIPYMGKANTSSEIIHLINDVSDGKTPSIEDAPMISPSSKEEHSEPIVEKTEGKVAAEKEVKEKKRPSVQDLLNGNEEEYTNNVTPQDKSKMESNQKNEQINDTYREPMVRPTSANTHATLKGDMMRDSEVKRVEEELEQYYTEEPDKDVGTKVISVWSMKGGTGKTTIATNIALYLSMIDNGRSKYKVCLVDYNIESGDVRSLLGFHGEKIVDMSIWAEDIHQQIAHGMRPENISFTKSQIEKYLERYNEKTGLSVLLAPELHETAQYIEPAEIQVMLDNIIQNGGFDFIICDTADNTSDSSYYAIEKSDYVFMICTQDVTTANRNDSALRSLKRSGVNTDKFKVIVNVVSSRKKSGVSVAEVEAHFSEYECIGRVHETKDVIHANNFSKPLVYKPNHEFTEDLRPIIEFITKKKEANEKKGFINKLFGK